MPIYVVIPAQAGAEVDQRSIQDHSVSSLRSIVPHSVHENYGGITPRHRNPVTVILFCVDSGRDRVHAESADAWVPPSEFSGRRVASI
jgi:hypothetical protein